MFPLNVGLFYSLTLFSPFFSPFPGNCTSAMAVSAPVNQIFFFPFFFFSLFFSLQQFYLFTFVC